MIPSGGTITFEEIAEKTGLKKKAVRRLFHHAMAMRIMKEPHPEVVAHTSTSKFRTIPYVSTWAELEARFTRFLYIREKHEYKLTPVLRPRS
jgi:hypothetical protein